jgi:N-acetylmuramoyl-L-alanine amidase
MILLSVAHSAKEHGASNEANLLDEYTISLRASMAAFRRLIGAHVKCMIFDCGWLADTEYAPVKTAVVNAIMPDLALELHCNSAFERDASYSEVLHHPDAVEGKEAAEYIARGLALSMGGGNHRWPSHGARPNTTELDKHHDFFLWNTKAPAVIVEGLFLSNQEQAAWLARNGAEAYGLIVADAILDWLKTKGIP